MMGDLMAEKLSASLAVIVTSMFWLFILAVSHSGYDINAYREGYAEGKSGLPERWNEADFSIKSDKR